MEEMLGTSAIAPAAARRVVGYKQELNVHVYVTSKPDRRLPIIRPKIWIFEVKCPILNLIRLEFSEL